MISSWNQCQRTSWTEEKKEQKARIFRILCCILFNFSSPVVIVSLIFSQDSDLFLQLLDLKKKTGYLSSEYILITRFGLRVVNIKFTILPPILLLKNLPKLQQVMTTFDAGLLCCT
jgi:hypothetical protein